MSASEVNLEREVLEGIALSVPDLKEAIDFLEVIMGLGLSGADDSVDWTSIEG